jgi:hypothetical protein
MPDKDCCSSLPSLASVHLRPLPPERRTARSRPTTLGCGSCCCCLHTIGSIIGAAIMSPGGYDKKRERYRPSAALYYWPIFAGCLLLSVLGGVGYAFLEAGGQGGIPEDGVIVALIGFALGLPVVQLFAPAPAALVIFCVVHPEQRRDYLRSLGKITLGTVLGTIGGLVVMALLCMPFFFLR